MTAPTWEGAAKTCCALWNSHGCDLAPHHDGDHLCLFLAQANWDEDLGETEWIWQDTGGYCNYWDGKEIGFFHLICSEPDSGDWKPQCGNYHDTCTGGCTKW